MQETLTKILLFILQIVAFIYLFPTICLKLITSINEEKEVEFDMLISSITWAVIIKIFF